MPIQIVINENYVAKILIHPRQCKKMTFTKIEKENTEIFADFPHSFNECIKNGVFLSYFKKADTTPIYKKGFKDDYRPVSILPNILKIFERHMVQQISSFLDKIFSIYQCQFTVLMSLC